jgi:pre-mRNA cleavage complex 2 protein Pcf11
VTQQFPPVTPQPKQEVDLGALHRDIEGLISTARAEFANNPLDPSTQQRLKALLDLQGILQRQELPQDQLKLVRDQVSALAPLSRVASQPPPSLPQNPPAVLAPAVSTPPTYSLPQQAQSANLHHLLNPGTLTELLKATANRQQPTPPPQPSKPLPQIRQATTSQAAVAAPAAPETSLIASLRARGLLPPVATAPAAPNLPLIIPGQVRYTPPISTQLNSTVSDVATFVQMGTASIKM